MDAARRIDRKKIYDGRVVRLSVDTVRLPNGKRAELELVRHRGAAAIVPLDDDGQVLLVRQYRYAARRWLLEVPAGTLERQEPPERCARREVEEETGYRPSRIVPLGWIFTTPGFTDEKIWLYLATDLSPTGARLDEDEVLTVERVPLADAVERAASGEIVDAKSICALSRAARALGFRVATGS
ncbi:MAG TPA: NUDIX hydrolase [Candidatus Polarisedimenticolaceae bacterium]|nr:NUDIX hydrolase [Candidatus Polarisedimenticolaceae bacterium]